MNPTCCEKEEFADVCRGLMQEPPQFWAQGWTVPSLFHELWVPSASDARQSGCSSYTEKI